MLKYEFGLKNEKARAYIIISWLIVIMNLIGLMFMIGITETITQRYLVIVAIAGILLILFYWRLTKRNDQENAKFNYSFSAIWVTWMFCGYYWLAGVNFILYLLQFSANSKLKILFYPEKIVYPGSITDRTIEWSACSNIILKDGLLTMDYKNNRISQYFIEDDKEMPDEQEFNDFCRSHLQLTDKIV